MADVLQVITALEGIQITKEQLESTRLGKHINHLRRMTKNESLARRAKNLLKKWREMVLPTANAAASAVTAAPSAPSNPINSMPPSAMMPMNGYATQEHRSHQNLSMRGGNSVPVPLHDSDVGAGNLQNHHSNGNKKSTSNSNRKFGVGGGGGGSGGGGGGSSSMPANNYSCNNSVNSVAEQLIVDPIEADVQRKPISNSKQRRNASDASTIVPPSDPYRFLQMKNDSGESKSPISISALPKIPKKSSSLSASALNVNKLNVDRSHSPLLLNSSSGIKSNQSSPSSKWMSTSGGGPAHHQQQQQKLFSSITDDNTVHQYDMHLKSAINGRDQNFYSLNSGEKTTTSSFSLADNNSNSSSMRERDVLRGGTTDPSSISDRTNTIITSESKKKHKKNKKEKKKKRHSASQAEKSTEHIATMTTTAAVPPPPTIATAMAPITRVAVPAPVVFELADSLSSSSMSLFNSTNNSMKPLPKINTVGDNGGGGGSRSVSRSASTIPPADLTFSGKFSKTEDTVINIDSSSCSNSPKYAKLPSERSRSPLMAVPSRSSSPIQMKQLLANRLTTLDDAGFGQSTSASAAVVPPLPSFVGDHLSQVKRARVLARHVPRLISLIAFFYNSRMRCYRHGNQHQWQYNNHLRRWRPLCQRRPPWPLRSHLNRRNAVERKARKV